MPSLSIALVVCILATDVNGMRFFLWVDIIYKNREKSSDKMFFRVEPIAHYICKFNFHNSNTER